jgi:hypothetical protein
MQGSSSFDFDDLVKWLDSDKSNDFLSSKYGDEVTLSEYINTLSGTIDKNE